MKRSFLLPRFFCCAFWLLAIWSTPYLHAVVGNCWHIPDNAEVSGANMRNPRVEISNNLSSPTTVTIYNGNQFQGSGNPGNQTGGTLYYKGATQGTWQTASLSFHLQSGNNKYWKATFSTSSFGANEVIQYYLLITYSDKENTYIYGNDHQSFTTNSQSTAATSPFTVRNRPGWIFHADNRVVSGSDVQFWAKVGYVGDTNDNTTRWATNGALYYTTDGSTPAGALGVGSGSTQVVAFSYDHPETGGNNQGSTSIAGTPMWWMASIANVPTSTTIKYKIGFWNSQNNEEKFAEYNAGDSSYTGREFSFALGAVGDPVLTVNGVNANYTTSKLFVDEVAGDSQPLAILFQPAKSNITAVEIYTNLNRRDRAGIDANSDGVEDGIVPVDGNTLVAGDDSQYFKAYTMSSAGAGQYSLTLSGSKTGAYRLTARFKVSDAISENGFNPNTWIWYTNGAANRRDHAITISPVQARDIRLYEMNVFNVEANGTTFAERSTLEDLHNASNAPHNGSNRWDLDYLTNLGCNWLWFQPIHPVGVEGRESFPGTSTPYDPGSPYSVKNFFEVNELMSVNYSGTSSLTTNRQSAMTAFQNFVAAADAKGVGVMLDAPFNHTAWDAELAPIGQTLFGGTSATQTIKSQEARFYSRTSNYAQRAYDASSIATAPDRGDFGKWNDVKDVYFGRYAALVDINPDGNGNYANEGDWFDYSIGSEGSYGSGNGHFDSVTRNVWKYFAEYSLFWLEKTGVPAGSNLAVQTANGIDGLRADFGQGLPPQLWEYIVNKTRARKWNFVFMAESLDGGAVTYRSNRHFDVLNENIVFPLKSASFTSDFRAIFENRRSAYGQGLVLLNNTSHDEENYDDPWYAVIRYAVCSTIDGVPLIFPGQELGISRTTGYSFYETNFGKQIAHFKRWNSMMPAWNDQDYGNDQLYPVYRGIGTARGESKALRASGRYFLDRTGGAGAAPSIFSVAKYETANASPATTDVVFGFVNLDRSADNSATFNVNITQGGSNLFGIKSGRTYNAKNRAAYTAIQPGRRDAWLWGNGTTGSTLLSNGITVFLKKVPTTVGGWSTDPYEAQYLKLYDVTAPATVPGQPGGLNAYGYQVGGTATFTWQPASADSEGVVPQYRVDYSINGGAPTSDYTSGTSYSVTASAGQTVTVTVYAVNPNDTSKQNSTGASGSGIKLLSSGGDEDGDGIPNAAEDSAGTNPLDSSSRFAVSAVSIPATGQVTITWSSVPGKKYQVEKRSALGSGDWVAIGSQQTAGAGETSKSYTDSGASGGASFYRVRLVP